MFQIEWDGNKIIYNPLEGLIYDVKSTDIIHLRGNTKKIPQSPNVFGKLPVKDFRPFCLTIYNSNTCNLSCSYCYIQKKSTVKQSYISLSAVHASANIVAKNCAKRNMPFILGFHGGNEPLLNVDMVKECIEICRKITKKYDLKFISFCTTNGVISADVAEWAARTFYGIRLSWDGPPDIHDKYRSNQNGIPSSNSVIRSAKIFLDRTNKLKEFIVRATITNNSVNRLQEIIKYFYKQGARWIELYPAFQNLDKSINEDIPPNTIDYIKNFIITQEWAKNRDIKLIFSGSRLSDIHDKHCLVNQNNLTITPDGYLTACFLSSNNDNNDNDKFVYGSYNQSLGKISIDLEKLSVFIRKISKQYLQCEKCFNYYHCSKGCPNICPIQDKVENASYFDCKLEKWISLSNIFQAVKYKISDHYLNNIDEFFSETNIRMYEG